MDSNDFRKAMRHCAGAVALVTVGREEGRRTGLTVTAVCSLSDDPPSLLVCVNRKASANPRIREERCFGVSFLAEEHMPLALTFSGQKGFDGENRFGFGRWSTRVTGAPVLEEAIVSFDCELRQEFETRTHSVFVGDVRDAGMRGAASPLLYLNGAFHGVHAIRDAVSLGDLEARKLSWSIFS
ncbi:flavin reductase family protein [Rhodopseudomonas sp. P2A-2r]|uniref:flavin reductase family protein n=1 Tax=Rhodopseudomonas sp. P2A-2r TaxID=2991972 RepID=UPI002233E768|nr:flavin reductase family protein [Rhodopseudomonas sp. P2A-2r]UZE50057.1 flavin reductase family protein [Rhodopseudomonas sp. P2A-2r]